MIMILLRKLWRIYISISQLATVLDDINASIKEVVKYVFVTASLQTGLDSEEVVKYSNLYFMMILIILFWEV